jgi:hypothetical protein
VELPRPEILEKNRKLVHSVNISCHSGLLRFAHYNSKLKIRKRRPQAPQADGDYLIIVLLWKA